MKKWLMSVGTGLLVAGLYSALSAGVAILKAHHGVPWDKPTHQTVTGAAVSGGTAAFASIIGVKTFLLALFGIVIVGLCLCLCVVILL